MKITIVLVFLIFEVSFLSAWDISRIGAIKKGDEILGNETRVKVLKNKVAPPFKQAEFQILYNEGISLESEIIDLGVKHGFVEKAGAWYSIEGERIGQGKDNARDYLKEHTELSQSVEAKIREKLMSGSDDSWSAKMLCSCNAHTGQARTLSFWINTKAEY